MPSSLETKIEETVANQAASTAGTGTMKLIENQLNAGNLIVAGGLVVGVGLVAGICYTGLKWHQREEKEHMRQAMLLEQNHADNLKRIAVGKNKEIAFPDFFIRDPKTGLLHAAKDYKTVAELNAMVHERGSVGFPPEADDEITRAMKKLLEFYNDRLDSWWGWGGSEGDATSVFLRYHICRLFEYGKKYQGAEYTKGILTAIHASLNQFSMEHGPKSLRRTMLDLACRSLTSAMNALEEKKKHRTLAEIVADATPDIDESAVSLTVNLTKFVTPEKHWVYVDRCEDARLLADGFIKKETEHGKPGTHPAAIMLHKSPMGQNISKIAQRYNVAKGLSPAVNNPLRIADFTPEEQAQNVAMFTEKQKHLGIGWGQRISNFMTTTSRLKNRKSDSGETVPLTAEHDQRHIDARIDLILKTQVLNDDNVLMLSLYNKLERYAEEKGNEFIANPANAQYMFDVLLALGAQMRKDAESCDAGFDVVKKDHELRTLPPVQKLLLMETKQLVSTIREEVESSIKTIKNYRTETHYEEVKAEINVYEHETLQLFHAVATARNLDLRQRIVTAKDKKLPLPAAKVGMAATGSSVAIGTALAARRVPRPVVAKPEITLENIDHLLADIQARIILNGKEEIILPYERLHQALVALRNQYFKMHNDISHSDRLLKANATKDLLHELC